MDLWFVELPRIPPPPHTHTHTNWNVHGARILYHPRIPSSWLDSFDTIDTIFFNYLYEIIAIKKNTACSYASFMAVSFLYS